MAISPARSGQYRGVACRARRRTCNLYKPPSKWKTLPTCHCEAPTGPWRPEREARGSALGVQSREGIAISPKASPRSDCVLRDCHVALLLAMTHQVVRRCTSALLPLNGSVQGGHYPQGARPSVRRQSRQRLRSDRRYSQIWQRVRSAMACTGCNCLPEIAPQGHFLALRAQGATSLCSSQ